MHHSSSDTSHECAACEKTASWAGVYANLALALFKGAIGLLSGSKALIGDGLFSFKDCIASLVVVIGVRVSGKPADEQHPYGHGKIEYVALFLISVGLLISTLFLLVYSAKGLWSCYDGTGSIPGVIAFWGALISVVANYPLSRYLGCAGERMQSPALLANARHNRSNIILSVMVGVAVLGAHYLDFTVRDPLVAFIEAILLVRMGIEMLGDSLGGLFDSAVPVESVERIEMVARLVPGVRKVTRVVARNLGQGIWVDMTIKVDSTLNHQQGYLIGQHVKESIQALLGNHTTINVLFEPYLP